MGIAVSNISSGAIVLTSILDVLTQGLFQRRDTRQVFRIEGYIVEPALTTIFGIGAVHSGHRNRYKERIGGGDNHLGNLGFHQQIQAQIQIGSFRLTIGIGQRHCSAAVGSNIGFQSILDSGGVGFQLGRQGIDQNVTLEVIFVGIQMVSIGIPLFSAFQPQSLQEVGALGFVNAIENFHMAGSIPICCRLGELNNISNPKIAELDSLNSIAVADFPITKIGLIGAAQNIVHAFFIIAARGYVRTVPHTVPLGGAEVVFVDGQRALPIIMDNNILGRIAGFHSGSANRESQKQCHRQNQSNGLCQFSHKK